MFPSWLPIVTQGSSRSLDVPQGYPRVPIVYQGHSRFFKVQGSPKVIIPIVSKGSLRFLKIPILGIALSSQGYPRFLKGSSRVLQGFTHSYLRFLKYWSSPHFSPKMSQNGLKWILNTTVYYVTY